MVCLTRNLSRTRCAVWLAAAAATCLAAPVDALATGSTWVSDGTTLDWSSPGNWSGGGVPNVAGSTAIFGTGTAATVDVGAGVTVGNIEFTGLSAYMLGGAGLASITLDNNGSTSMISSSSAYDGISSPVILNNNAQIYMAPSGGGINISGAISGTGDLTVNKASPEGTANVILETLDIQGTFTNASVGGGYVDINDDGGGHYVGSDVVRINQYSSTVPLLIAVPIRVNSAGTTLANNLGAATLEVFGGVVGTGDLNIIDDHGTTSTSAFSFQPAAVNNVGAINISGTAGGYSAWFQTIGSNVVAINHGSAGTSVIKDLVVNTEGTTLSVNSGGVLMIGAVSGTGDVVLKNNTGDMSGIRMATSVSFNNSGRIVNQGAGAGKVVISGVIGAEVQELVQDSATAQLVINSVQESATPVTVKRGALCIYYTGAMANSLVTVKTEGSFNGMGPVGGLVIESGGHGRPDLTSWDPLDSGYAHQAIGSLALASGANLDLRFHSGSGDHANPAASSGYAVSGGASALTLSQGIMLNLTSAPQLIGNGSYELISYGDSNEIEGWVDTEGTIIAGVVSMSESGTIVLGSGWSAVGNGHYSIVNDAERQGIFLDFSDVSGVPEPGSLALLGLGTGLILSRRSRRCLR